MKETSIPMYAAFPSGEPCIRVIGNFRPTESALREVRQHIQQVYDEDEAEQTMEAKAESIPQDRDLEDFHGCFVKIGSAKFDKQGGVRFEDRDYEFEWGEMNLIGRQPTDCDKGYYEDADNFYSQSDVKPTEW